MRALYPLRFQPLLRRHLWGGRRLESLGKSLGSGNDYAESWEIVDRGADQSVVVAGPLAGRTLAELVREHGQALLGRHAPADRFPLLVKFLDASDRLSIQVHPDDARAARLDPPDFGKTEAWVILAADEGSYLYGGLRKGIDRQTLRRELARQTCELCVERIEPSRGRLLPPSRRRAACLGTRFAGCGNPAVQRHDLSVVRLAAQRSRWQAPAAARRRGLGGDRLRLRPTEGRGAGAHVAPEVERLVACDKFLLDRWRFSGRLSGGGDQRCHVLMVLEGEIRVEHDPNPAPLTRGAVVLLPAELGSVEITASPTAVVLDVYLP